MPRPNPASVLLIIVAITVAITWVMILVVDPTGLTGVNIAMAAAITGLTSLATRKGR